MGREEALAALRDYDGRSLRIMEVCGTHTAAIMRNGIPSLLSPGIRLVSGPGCPVCVTPAAYIDRLMELSLAPDTCVLTFADMLRVPGGAGALQDVRGRGGQVRAIYSPLEAVELARANPRVTYVAAAVGFETTAPAFALMLSRARAMNLPNLRALTALKTMLPPLDMLGARGKVDAFLCPGHVSVIIGSDAYKPLAAKYRLPYVVAGFGAEHILAALYAILRQLEGGRGEVENLYPSAVTPEGNTRAQALLAECFEPCDAVWRGIGVIPGSGLRLRGDYRRFDAGGDVCAAHEAESDCRCGDVILGELLPPGCPLFGMACTPEHPVGPCMVSAEGSCGIWYSSQAN